MDRQTDYFGDAIHDSVTTELDLLSIDVENTGNSMNQLENVTDEDKIREDSASASNVSQSHDINSESETESINAKITSIADHMLNHMTWPPYVVVGPPGTGKTESLVYSCMSLMQGWGKRKPARVLLATYNDRGADSMLDHIRRVFDAGELPITIRRVHKPATPASEISNDIIKYCYISNNITTLPDVATLSDVGIVVTTFDIISYIYQINSEKKAKYTHILLDDVHKYPFDKLCSFMGAIPDKTSVAMTLGTLLSDTTRQAASSTDLQPSTTRDPSKRIFLSNLQSILANPKNVEPFVFENFQRLSTNYQHSKNMLDFVNTYILDEQDVMQPNKQVDSDFKTPPVQMVTRFGHEMIEQFADSLVYFQNRWSDRELAVILLNQRKLEKVQETLKQKECSTVSLFTVDSVPGHHFDTVYLFIGTLTEVPLCLSDVVSIQTLLTCASTQLVLFVDKKTVKLLCDTSPLWKKVIDQIVLVESEHGKNADFPIVSQSDPNRTHSLDESVRRNSTDNTSLLQDADGNEHGKYNVPFDSQSVSDYAFSVDEQNSTDGEYIRKNFEQFNANQQFMDADENNTRSSTSVTKKPTAIAHVDSPEPWNEYAPSNVSHDSILDPYSKWRSAPNSECNLSLKDDYPIASNQLRADGTTNEPTVTYPSIKKQDEDVGSYISHDADIRDNYERDDEPDEYHIPIEPTYDAIEECNALYPETYKIPFPPDREDYRSLFTITVGQGEDRAVALSAGRLASGDIWLLIHVTDVTHFVGQDSEMDRYASNKGYSLYIPGKEVVYMLPKRLSTDLCSFLPGKDRLAWSVLFLMDNNFNIKDNDDNIKRSMIRVDKAFTHEDIDNFVNNATEITVDMVEPLEIFQNFSKVARANRLGNASASFTNIETTSFSLMMITEITTFTNYFISRRLLAEFDDKTPLLNQHKTHSSSRGWKMRYADIARHSLSLSYRYLRDFTVCECTDRCICVPVDQLLNSDDNPMYFCEISKSRWSKVEELYKNKDLEELKVLLSDVLNYPETCFALHEITELMKRDVYSTATDPNKGHHLLNYSTYTTFTQPLQRFIDIVVQRMLYSSVCYKELHYSSDNMDEICYKSTAKIDSGKNDEYREYLHLVTTAMKQCPLSVEMIISKVNLAEIKLANPLALLSPSSVDTSRDMKYKPSMLLDRTFDVRLNNLMLSEKPEMIDRDLRLEWQQLIYSLAERGIVPSRIVEDEQFNQIDSDYLTKRVAMEDIEKLARALRSNNKADLIRATKRMTDYGNVENNATLKDFSSEILHTTADEPGVCNVFGLYQVGTTVQVQLASGIDHIMDVPRVQLFSLSPTVDICVEHNRKKAKCFIPEPVKRVDDDVYTDVEDYKQRWVDLINYEAVESAIASVGTDSAFFHGLNISWERDMEDETITGTFTLSQTFTENRSVPRNGYICVRYKNMTTDTTAINASVRELFKKQESFTWVGHCLVTSLQYRNRMVTATMKLHSSSVVFPEILLTARGEGMPCTIQWLSLPAPNEYSIRVIRNVGKGGIRDPLFDGSITVKEVREAYELRPSELPYIGEVNLEQEEAIRKAMSSNFSLIHGPPGTGKTMTAARLIYMLVERNKRNGFREAKQDWQVLYCAPSNKAADVILGHFRKMRSIQPNVIRVYSNHIETNNFGTQAEMTPKDSSKFSMDPLYQRFALHYVIREEGKPHANRIRSLDTIIHDFPAQATKKLRKAYRETVNTACREELEKADVVITTCTGCMNTRFVQRQPGGMRQVLRIRQVIIDEAGMSSVPETLIPLTFKTRLKQVTLIGDHKQLQPVLLTDKAEELGMLRSMFERYVDKPGMAVMLTTQYRMHQAIAAVPSKCFYDDKLRCGSQAQMSPSLDIFWPGGREFPIALCHVIGAEATTTVSTRESSDKSKSNEQEARIVERIARLLISRHEIKPEQIAILTQYRAQQSLIEKSVEDEFPNMTVNTVVSSQGDEWDYVILSTVRTINPEDIHKNPSPTWVRASLGFIAVDNQINVALTRAKKGLIIVGNSLLLKCHPKWNELVTYYHDNRAIVNADEFLRRLSGQI